MKKQILITLFIALFSFLSIAANKTVSVELNYGKNRDKRIVQVNFKEGMTALEALMHAAEITTYPLKKYVFVISIDGVKGKRGSKAWYYKINGESTGKLAIHKEIQAGDVVTWVYTKDVCSAKVDECTHKK